MSGGNGSTVALVALAGRAVAFAGLVTLATTVTLVAATGLVALVVATGLVALAAVVVTLGTAGGATLATAGRVRLAGRAAVFLLALTGRSGVRRTGLAVLGALAAMAALGTLAAMAALLVLLETARLVALAASDVPLYILVVRRAVALPGRFRYTVLELEARDDAVPLRRSVVLVRGTGLRAGAVMFAVLLPP